MSKFYDQLFRNLNYICSVFFFFFAMKQYNPRSAIPLYAQGKESRKNKDF